ncbi:hypothetical protein HRO26_02115 [Treponema pectinovorum]|uniref:hypothetical protein n=1 Tax=Treponema pectinovorum TaxID=164 RepID=UPI003D906152
MIDFEELKDNFFELFHKKPLYSLGLLIILLFFLIALIVIFIQSSKPKQKTYQKTDFVLDAKPLLPEGPEIEKNYYPERSLKKQWSQQEIEQWFTKPDSTNLKELERTNDKIVKEITGAAP